MLNKPNASSLPFNLDRTRDGKITTVARLIDDLRYVQFDIKNHIVFFRGHSDESWNAEPSIYRDGLIEKEHIIFRETISSIPEEFISSGNTFQKLVKMQHYGLPTRLLDITENPLIALYFACLGNPDKDGEILVYKVPRNEIKYFDSDTVSILSNIAKMKNDFSIQDMDKDWLLHEIRQEKRGFLPNINLDDLSKVLFVKPLLDNQRIIRQDGSFILFGIDGKKSIMTNIPEHYKVKKERKDFIIDAKSKDKILKQLEVFGIHHAKLFPEIDNVTRYIKGKYVMK